MKLSFLLKSLLLLAVGSIAVLEAFRFGQGIALHGSLSSYWEARGQARQLEKAMDLIRAYYVDDLPLEGKAMNESALQGIVGQLDPYTEFLDMSEFDDLRADADQEFGGIGIQVEMRDGSVLVVAPIEGTPGERAGLMNGDQIVGVDGRSLEGIAFMDVIDLLRGKPGSDVAIKIYRPSNEETFSKTLRREIIEVENVKEVMMLADKVGYLRLLQFGAKTGQEVAAAIDTLKAQGMQALVLDVRNNPGGLLESAVEIAELFLPKGRLIVYMEGRHPDSNVKWYSNNGDTVHDFPIAILANGGSASASEIVAGALKDAERAVIVGEKTFGKGSVQSILPLSNGTGIKLTTAKYYTPAGYVIHERGVEPDIRVELSMEEARQLTVQRNRLPFMDRSAFVEQFGFQPIADRQLDEALAYLQSELTKG